MKKKVSQGSSSDGASSSLPPHARDGGRDLEGRTLCCVPEGENSSKLLALVARQPPLLGTCDL